MSLEYWLRNQFPYPSIGALQWFSCGGADKGFWGWDNSLLCRTFALQSGLLPKPMPLTASTSPPPHVCFSRKAFPEIPDGYSLGGRFCPCGEPSSNSSLRNLQRRNEKRSLIGEGNRLSFYIYPLINISGILYQFPRFYVPSVVITLSTQIFYVYLSFLSVQSSW